ncbi:MAG: ATP-binding cassette domain-containing protein [Rhodobacteraceae bacterium]|nr:ATP-binding cassette domain-containing protein [Paracoccaceae bacterium]
MNTLTFDNVSVSRGGQVVLGPIDLRLQLNGITCLLGPNGAGKSVFLNLCHGMFSPDNGVVDWNGKSAISTRRDRSFMFQSAAVMRRSVQANVAFPLVAQKIAKAERLVRVGEALRFARLSDQAKQPAASLSGGEKQRMALARAWVTRPKVILLDEPAANLDPGSTRALETMLRDVANSSGVMIATHDLLQARRLADHVLVFVDGRLEINQSADAFFTKTHTGVVADYLDGRI